MSRRKRKLLQRSLIWGALWTLIFPVAADEASPNDLEVLKYIHCAVDFDMFEKILNGTPEEDKTLIFGEGITAFEEEAISFFKNGSDFFTIKAVDLSSKEHVAASAKKRYEKITSGFESHHQAQLEEIVSNGHKCLEILKTELQTIRSEADGN